MLEYPVFIIPNALSEKSDSDRSDYVFIKRVIQMQKGHEYMVEGHGRYFKIRWESFNFVSDCGDPVFCRWIEAATGLEG